MFEYREELCTDFCQGSTISSLFDVVCTSGFNLQRLWQESVVIQVWFSFQPPSHLLERRSAHYTLLKGGKVGIYRGSMEHVRHSLMRAFANDSDRRHKMLYSVLYIDSLCNVVLWVW